MDVCQVCHQSKEWHDTHRPHHIFVKFGEEPRLAEAQPPTPPPLRMGDPVLRLALIKAGVLREQDITEAEVWLREAANEGMAVVVVEGGYKLLSIEEWIDREASHAG